MQLDLLKIGTNPAEKGGRPKDILELLINTAGQPVVTPSHFFVMLADNSLRK